MAAPAGPSTIPPARRFVSLPKAGLSNCLRMCLRELPAASEPGFAPGRPIRAALQTSEFFLRHFLNLLHPRLHLTARTANIRAKVTHPEFLSIRRPELHAIRRRPAIRSDDDASRQCVVSNRVAADRKPCKCG